MKVRICRQLVMERLMYGEYVPRLDGKRTGPELDSGLSKYSAKGSQRRAIDRSETPRLHSYL